VLKVAGDAAMVLDTECPGRDGSWNPGIAESDIFSLATAALYSSTGIASKSASAA
jgi:hypothetical protein